VLARYFRGHRQLSGRWSAIALSLTRSMGKRSSVAGATGREGRKGCKTNTRDAQKQVGRQNSHSRHILSRRLCSIVCQCLGVSFLLVPTGLAQNLQYWTMSQLSNGDALCHTRVSALSCDRQLTSARSMTYDRNISSFADLVGIGRTQDSAGDSKNPIFDSACRWNPVVQTCEYRCNHLYQFPPFRISERLDSIRIGAHYVYEQYGAACTAFNIRPEQNGNRECTICEDPNFNPPECYKIKNAQGMLIEKNKDCMTKCNMLPNCTRVCTNLVKDTPSYAGVSQEVVYMDCCMPQRRQLNGETEDIAREQCCREYQLMQGHEVHVARNICCNAIETTLRGHTPYCASEICHFRIMEENISNSRDAWVEQALETAMAEECGGGRCGVLGTVVSTSDGQMGGAMENNLISATDPPLRSRAFFEIVLSEIPFNALLNPDTVKTSTGIVTLFEESVRVGSFYFNAYFKYCNVNEPCKLQEGIAYENLKKKYVVLHRALLAAGYFPDAIQEMLYRQAALRDWEDTLPPYVPPLAQFAVPDYVSNPARLPVASAIDHFHSLQASRRRALGEAVETQYGPAAGSHRVDQCRAEQGLMCISESGARQFNRRRSDCRPMSLYRPDEHKYSRPPWRRDLDRWQSSFGDLGEWKSNFTAWRTDHANAMLQIGRSRGGEAGLV
jgi:hypothetical protein